MKLESVLYLVALIAALASLYIMFRIVKRTEKRLRTVFIFFFAAFALFAAFLAARNVESMGSYDFGIYPDLLLTLFTLSSAASLYYLGRVVRDITDRAQILTLTDSKEHEAKLLKALKGIRGKVCYVSVARPCDDSRRLLAASGVRVENFQFLGFSGEGCADPELEPGKSRLVSRLLSEIVEKDFDVLVVDDLSALGLDEMELEHWVSQVTLKARDEKMQSLFFMVEGRSSDAVAKDLGMFMDKVIR